MQTAASRRFSSSRRFVRSLRPHAGLIAGAVGAVAALTAVAVVATNGFHFHHSTSARAKVSTYIQSVDQVERQMNYRITKVMAAYRAYTSNSRSAASVPQLEAAGRTLHVLARRIESVPAPPQAAHLRVLLGSLLASEQSVTEEVAQLARFSPAFHTIAVQLQALSVELSKALAAVPQPKPHRIKGTPKQIKAAQAAFNAAAGQAAQAQASVVDTYDAALGVLLDRLGRIAPPQVMVPAYSAEVATLRATRAAGARLATGLRAAKRKNVALLSRRFSLAARTAGATFRQKEEIAAVKAYDARVRRIGRLEVAVQQELSHLANTVR